MWPKLLLLLILSVGFAVELTLLGVLLGAEWALLMVPTTGISWFFLHALVSLVVASSVALYVQRYSGKTRRGSFLMFFIWCLGLSLPLPLFGIMGIAGALIYGLHHSDRNYKREQYWQFTANPELPFTTPLGRKTGAFDSRGFVEQFLYDENEDVLYHKVLAAANVRSSLSVDALKTAVLHKQERIRLTAYQSLDKKITALNLDIQKLEKLAEHQQDDEKSNTWLHIASNYWELLTLEKDEPIARRQLLEKAAAAAAKSSDINPRNRNAFFTLGRVSLMQGNLPLAEHGLERAYALGMPRETVVPYLAELAFSQRDFGRVRRLLQSIDSAFSHYPPLRQLADYWA